MAKTDEIPVVIETLGPTAQGFSFALEKFQGRVQLRALHRPNYGPIYADWLSPEARRRIASGKKQLIARAVGLHKNQNVTILDCTAGLGRDGFTLAALGARVSLVERHPMIYALLSDAFRRASEIPQLSDICKRMELIKGDGREVMKELRWQVIYLDPMYPHSGSSALPQKEMQIFRDLNHGDSDAGQLLLDCHGTTAKRIVVKRPSTAPYLTNCKPQHQVEGSQTRFDVYVPAV